MKSMYDMGTELMHRAYSERLKNGSEYPKALVCGFPPVVCLVRNEKEEQRFRSANAMMLKIAAIGLAAILVSSAVAVLYISFGG